MEDSKGNGFVDIEKMAAELLQNGNGVPPPPFSTCRNGVAVVATEIPLHSIKDAKYEDYKDTGNGVSQGGVKNCCHQVKIAYLVLLAMMVSVWVLLSLPIVFYHIPVAEQVREFIAADYIFLYFYFIAITCACRR